jgi:hypothetical protein
MRDELQKSLQELGRQAGELGQGLGAEAGKALEGAQGALDDLFKKK